MRFSIALAAVLALSACEGAPAEGEGEEGEGEGNDDPFAPPACEVARAGVNVAHTASDGQSAASPDVSDTNVTHDVALVDRGGGATQLGGFVQLTTEGGAFVVFASRDVPMRVVDFEGVEVVTTRDDDVEACVELAISQRGDWPEGTVHIELGPTDEPEVALVIVGGE